MVGETLAGLGALKTAFDIAKGLKDVDNAVGRNTAVIELQEKILAAREAQSALLERVGELEEKVASFERWDAEKVKYELRAVFPGSFAYVPKPDAQSAEPSHWLCAACFGNRKKSFLQRTGPISGVSIVPYRCSVCSHQIIVSYQTNPDKPYGSKA